MTHKVTKRMSAENVPLLLTYWLEDGGLPYDITVKQRKCHGLRLVVFTITGSTKEDVAAKCVALDMTIAKLEGGVE